MAARKPPVAKRLPIFRGYGMIADELRKHPDGASSAEVAAGISKRYGEHSGWTTRAAATEISWGRRSGYPFSLRESRGRWLWFLDEPASEEVAVAMRECSAEAAGFVYPRTDARALLQRLIHDSAASSSDGPNAVLRVEGDDAIVATAQSPHGQAVPIALLQRVLDEARAASFERGEDAFDATPFELYEERADGTRSARVRPGQQRFKRAVLQRYGHRCALCAISERELIHAAHLVPDASGGTNDPRNGLPLCANHHLAFDCSIAAIEPVTTRVHVASGHTPEALGILRADLGHLPMQPAEQALRFRWEHSARSQWQPVDLAA